MFEFYGFIIQVRIDDSGVSVTLHLDDDDRIDLQTPIRDPLCIAAMLSVELDLLFHDEIEALAGMIDAHL